MSLLDDVSIVVTPNGYKAGELYAVIPVPTEGAELVTNGDFSSGSTGWTIINGTVTDKYNASMTAYQSGIRISPFNKTGTYKVSFDLVVTSGSCKFDAGGGNNQTYSTSGTKEILVINTSKFEFNAFNLGWVGTLDNVSVKEWTGADMDVTRATAATRVDENGLVNYAEIVGAEEVTNGDFATDTDWTKGTGWTISGDKAIYTGTANASLNQSNALISGKFYKLQYEVISSSLDGNFKISGVTESAQSPLSQSVGTHTVYFTADGSAPTNIALRVVFNTTGTLEIDNVSVKEVTRDNVPRIDYSGCPHILAEPQRTNVNTYSEDFSQSFYIKDSGVSVGTTNNISPSGESNATKIDVTDNGRIYANVASDTYTSSVFIKAGTFAYFKIGGVNIDLVAGTNANGTIDSLGSGWFRVGINYTGNRPFQIQAYPDGTYSSHTTTGDYYIWGSQIESGSYATSYIPTDGGTVTRLKDTVVKSGFQSDGIFGSTEGSAVFDFKWDLTNYVLDFYDSSGVKMRIFNSSNNSWYLRDIAGSAWYLTGFTIAEGERSIIAFKWNGTQVVAFQDGEKSSATGTFASSMAIDSISNNNLNNLSSMKFYKTALTDDELKTLTTI